MTIPSESKSATLRSQRAAAIESSAIARNDRRNGDRDGGDSDPEPQILVPDPVVWSEFGVTPMTGYRWTNDEELGFPPAVKIRNRNFRSRRLLEEFKAKQLRKALGKV
jgi:hypothetical protein